MKIAVIGGGINGIMIDVDSLGGTPSDTDFVIRVNDMNPDTWSVGPAPTVSVRPGEGGGGSDRVTLTWDDGAICNQWVEVTVLSDTNGGGLGLVDNDVFYFGNSVGDCDGDGQVGEGDYGTLLGEFGRSGGGLTADFNGDGWVGMADFMIMRSRFGRELPTPAFPNLAAEATAVAPEALLQVVAEPTAVSAALVSPIAATQPLDVADVSDDSDDVIVATAYELVVDLLVAPLSAGSYIPEPKQSSVERTAITLSRAATAEYDLHPLSDDFETADEKDPLVDILAESALVLPL